MAQPYQTEVIYLLKEITFPERMNETLEGLKDNVDLGTVLMMMTSPRVGQVAVVAETMVLTKNRPPPDPGEDLDLAGLPDGGGEIGEDERLVAVGDKILARAEHDTSGITLPSPPVVPSGSGDGRRSHDEVGPSGRLIPKGDGEEPGEIIKILKKAKLVPAEIEHWCTGIKGGGKIYLSDDGEAFKVDKRGVPYRVGSDGRRILRFDDLYIAIHLRNGRSWAMPIRKQHTRRISMTRHVLRRKRGRKPRLGKRL